MRVAVFSILEITMKSMICVVLALLVLACDRGAPAAAPTTTTAHAAATVKPGSHEDWCGEHQVPESQCTRCNPDLVPAFKATNDWCAEHGLPESQCLKCNPNLKIVRPPQGTP